MRAISPNIIAAALPIFANFLARDNFDVELAIEEFARIAPAPSTGEYLSGPEYVITRRINSAHPLNRASRLSIYNAFENALNHASFEVEQP